MFKSLKSKKELIKLTKQIIPPLLPQFYKGQCGRIAIIGGCEDYTGAPFFSAHAAATLGCDLTHVVCEISAAPVIKGYSPDLMVHPYLRGTDFLNEYKLRRRGGVEVGQSLDPNDPNFETKFIKQEVMPKVNAILDRIQVVVVGPGFGRDHAMLLTLQFILEEIRARNLPVVLDADALFLVAQKPEVISGYPNAIITPNIVEYRRICDALNIHDDDNLTELRQVSDALKVTIFQKGQKDIIISGENLITNDEKGSNKRVGGQGDSLTGMISTLLAWGMSAYKNKIWPESKTSIPQFNDEEIRMLACFGGSLLTKVSARKAFAESGRAMQTSDLHKHIAESYREVFDV
ncbi:DEKNAAC100747 [Brettanomyces naardenensis]|uniref:ATP-dependent (S)-NAD(P)H-hydrate dehydratase n=1 Tax=Brettanomyces naardenensis TaxID=13370 RepID=A0A448YFN5_BRENA|nr:DEKNAAC100747 [Brettanomyces naardenensis]